MRIRLERNLIAGTPSSDVLPGVLTLVAADHGRRSVAHDFHLMEQMHRPRFESRAGASDEAIELRAGQVSVRADEVKEEIHFCHSVVPC